ncbi:helicase associated domain-containing protein [Pelagophyceae sp. CCMP2097]|nr:helicase associated domain-containing protein [Pelagophyceae sp. CCMP2097]
MGKATTIHVDRKAYVVPTQAPLLYTARAGVSHGLWRALAISRGPARCRAASCVPQSNRVSPPQPPLQAPHIPLQVPVQLLPEAHRDNDDDYSREPPPKFRSGDSDVSAPDEVPTDKKLSSGAETAEALARLREGPCRAAPRIGCDDVYHGTHHVVTPGETQPRSLNIQPLIQPPPLNIQPPPLRNQPPPPPAAYKATDSRRALASFLRCGRWDAQLRRLAQYRSVFGHCVVPAEYVASDGARLGAWVAQQRHLHTTRRLSADRAQLLDAAGFALESFNGITYGRHPTSSPHWIRRIPDTGSPLLFGVPSGMPRSTWDCLDFHDSISHAAYRFAWSVGTEAWLAHYDLLRAYHALHGHALVPADFAAPCGARLGAWVAQQRHLRKSGKLHKDRAARLESVGFAWSVGVEAWAAHFAALLHFRDAYGHQNVPVGYVSHDGTKLGAWVCNQRHRNALGKLAHDRIQQLEGAGFQWRLDRREGALALR